MTITTVFDPPLPSDSPPTFNTKAFRTLGDLNDWSAEVNALASTLNANKDAAVASANTASTAASTATAKAGEALSSASSASTSAGTAAAQAAIATTKAAEAAASAANANNPTFTGNLNFVGTAQRITGDFSNATIANRVMFQTSTTNGNTQIRAIPNGTSNVASIQVGGNSDANNQSIFSFQINGLEAQVLSSVNGTGTYLPMTFYTGGVEGMRLDTFRTLNAGGYTGFGAATDCGIVTNHGIALAATGGGTNTSLHFNQVYSGGAFKALSTGYTANWLFTGTSGVLSLYGSNASVASGGSVAQNFRMDIDSVGNTRVGGSLLSLGNTGGLGYGPGAGGTASVTTNNQTITLNKPSMYVTLTLPTLAPNASFMFDIANSVSNYQDSISAAFTGFGGNTFDYQTLAIRTQVNTGTIRVFIINNSSITFSGPTTSVMKLHLIKGSAS